MLVFKFTPVIKWAIIKANKQRHIYVVKVTTIIVEAVAVPLSATTVTCNCMTTLVADDAGRLRWPAVTRISAALTEKCNHVLKVLSGI